jgi:predicted ATPase/DNA-binding CsgD family transcriptional regulator
MENALKMDVPNMCYTVQESLFGCKRQAKEAAMTQLAPIIQEGVLTTLRDGSPTQIRLDSPEWFAWLQTASTLTFQSEQGSFTARKERAGNRRGSPYWRAYHTRQGRLRRIYLGRSEELTFQRLSTVAERLGEARASVISPIEASLTAGATPPQASDAETHTRLHAEMNRSWQPFSAGEHSSSHQDQGSIRASFSRLPAPFTSLIGREQEQAALCRLLRQPQVRLVTLTGTGGVGKTRLAIEAAAALREDFADGVCFVSLAPVRAPEHVLAAIAQALGLWEVADRSPEVQVQDSLHDKHLLLLLDNVEQVLAAAPQLARLLTACPSLRLLVTSRASLHLSGEHEFALAPLAVPDLSRLPPLAELAQIATVRLFFERAQAIKADLALTEVNARAIAEICVQLDGLPLAIELAAGRSKLLPPQALLARLSHRLVVLTGGAQDLPARQQTLRDTLQWSYDLLTQEEQRLFRWLAVFVGGCTLEAAAAVCAAEREQPMDLLDGMASLLDKSLVQQTEREGAEPRLTMLETLREFGLDCLERQGELEAARRAHAHYFLALVEAAEPHLLGPEPLRWLERLEAELDNLRAILQAATTGGDEEVELALRLESALIRFWWGRGHVREGLSFLQRHLALKRRVAAPVRLAALIWLAGSIWTHSSHDVHGLEAIAEEALTLAREVGTPWHVILAMIMHGMAMTLERRDYDAAQVELEQCLTRARAFGDLFCLSVAFRALGSLALFQQDARRAVAWFEEDLAVGKAGGDAISEYGALSLLARAELSLGHAARAQALLEEALTLLREIGNPWGIAQILGLLGQSTLQQGKLSQAKAFLADSVRLAAEVADPHILAQSRLLLATVAALQGDYAVAHQQYAEGLSSALDIGHTGFIASGLKGLGCVAATQGLSTWAAILWGAAEPLRESHSVAIPPALSDRMIAVVRSELGEPAFEEARARGRAMTPAQALVSPERFSQQTPPIPTPPQLTPDASPSVLMRQPSFPAGLTSREVEVLRLVARGLTDAQVAEQLVISPRTVTTHLTSIYNKLAVNSRVAAARFAIEHDLT